MVIIFTGLKLSIKISPNKTISLEMGPSHTVKNLKETIQTVASIPVSAQGYPLHDRKQLNDEDTLKLCNIKTGDTIVLPGSLSGE